MENSNARVIKEDDFPQLSKNYPVFRFMGGNLISFFGDQIYLIAIPLIVLAITGSPFSMGAVAALERLPILLQPIIGILSDRLNRKRLLLICDFGRGLIVGLIGILFILDQLAMWHMYSGALIIGILSQIYNTSQFASVPNMVRRNDLHAVNSINTGIFNTAVLVAPGLGGLLISFYNPGYALLINSISFFIAFFTVLSITIKVTDTKSRGKRTFIEDIKEGFDFVVKTKPILFTNLAMLASIFGTTLFLTMMIFYLKDAIQLTTTQIGWLLSIGGIGAIFGSLATNFLKGKFSYRRILFFASFAGGLSIILFGLSNTYVSLILFNLMGTVAVSLMNPCIVTIRQTLTPDYLLGRVQATSRFMTWILLPIAALLAGVMAERVGTDTTILIGGAISTVASVVYLHPSLKYR
ncbi:MFS transporter [Virgibacillus necropolis]|uniref:MFS transporter n=1 Tax=Virgibacillus necropolis TaxID=163877 RepID=A0A221MHV6_9BACI|nr:MFS transporter [Virgibacillus necropolis]ASN07247.1 MFS transporter [Virgibacillus necropolis]